MFIDEQNPEGDIPPSLVVEVGVLVLIVKGDSLGTGSWVVLKAGTEWGAPS